MRAMNSLLMNILVYSAHKWFNSYTHNLSNEFSIINNKLGLYNASQNAMAVVVGTATSPYVNTKIDTTIKLNEKIFSYDQSNQKLIEITDKEIINNFNKIIDANNKHDAKNLVVTTPNKMLAFDIATTAFAGVILTSSIDEIVSPKNDGSDFNTRAQNIIHDTFLISLELYTKLYLAFYASNKLESTVLQKNLALLGIGAGVNIAKHIISTQEIDYIDAIVSGLKLPLYFIPTSYGLIQAYFIEFSVGILDRLLHSNIDIDTLGKLSNSALEYFNSAQEYLLGSSDNATFTQEL